MNDNKIIKNNLSTLLKRFSKTDVVSAIRHEYNQTVINQLPVAALMDIPCLKKAPVTEKRIVNKVNTIQEKGLPSPLIVVPRDDKYIVIFSRSTFCACKVLKMEYVSCIVLNMPDEDVLVFLLSFLRERKDASIVEMTYVLNELYDKFNYNQQNLADILQCSRSQIANLMRIGHLPEDILKDINEGKLSFTHVRPLLTLKENEMLSIIQEIREKHLSVHEVEKKAFQLKNKVDYSKQEKALKEKYQCQISVNPKKITFSLQNQKDLNRIIKLLKKGV